MESNFPRRHEIMELLKQFPIETIDGYGQCIVVPGEQFDPDWEGEIPNDCIETLVHDKPTMLIRLTLDSPLEPEVKPITEKDEQMSRWTKKDAEKLFKIASELHKTMLLKDVAHTIFLNRDFPERTEHAIKLKFAKMREKAGGPYKKRKEPEEVPVEAYVEPKRKEPTPEEITRALRTEVRTVALEKRINDLEGRLACVIQFVNLFSEVPPCQLSPKAWHDYWNKTTG